MIKISERVYKHILKDNPKIVMRTKDGYFLLGKDKKAKVKKLKDIK